MLTQSLLILSLVAAAIAVLLALLYELNVRGTGYLAARFDFAGESLPRVSVVIPARNEEQDIEKAVRSLLSQRHVELEIVAVNDHSTDSTGEILQRLAAEDSRLRIVDDPPLPPGWLGKPNAMAHAARAATADYLLFTDADIVHGPTSVATGLTYLQKEKVDFLSLFPLIVCESFWENVILPLGVSAGMAQFAGARVNDPKSAAAHAAGAFMLIKRETLEKIGGVEAIKAEILDDLSLAKLVKQYGFAYAYHFAPEMLTVRLFKDNKHAFWGMSKNVLLLTVGRPWMALPVILLPMVVFWIPLVAVAAGLWQGNIWLFSAGVAAPAVCLFSTWRVQPLCKFHWQKAVFYPLSAIPYACVLAKALVEQSLRGTVVWRDRAIRLSPTDDD